MKRNHCKRTRHYHFCSSHWGDFLKTVFFSIVCLVASCMSCFGQQRFEGPVRFAVIGDRTGGHSPGIYGEIITEIERLKPDFTMTVGDMIEGYTDDVEQIQAQWREYLTLIEPLSAPIHHTPGNHDIWGADNEAPYRLYEKRIGPANYAFHYRGVYIVVMENSRWESSEELPPEKIKWLEKVLKEGADAPYTLVFTHKPFWFESIAAGKPDRLHTLFKRYGVDAVFTGHYHLYFSGRYDGIVYTSMGSSGGSSYSRLTDFKYHFAWVTIDREGIHIAPIKKDSVLPHDVLTARNLTMVKTIESDAFQLNSPIEIGDRLKMNPTPWSFAIKNPHATLAVDAVMQWEIPDGWTLTPSSIPVKLKPGETGSISVTASCKGPLYPVPRFTLDMPYASGKTYELGRGVYLKRRAVCTRVESNVEIDGVVDEKAIRKYGETVFFNPKGQPASRADDFIVHLAYDEANLYISAICHESQPDKRLSQKRERDDAVYKDDHIGVLLAPPGQDAKAYRAYRIIVNPDGAIRDLKLIDTGGHDRVYEMDWNVDCQVATQQADQSWSVEIRMPVAQFGVKQVKPNDRWAVNFRRKQPADGREAEWMAPFIGGRNYLGALHME
jgi:nucleotide-binding universal stress UspA family protein